MFDIRCLPEKYDILLDRKMDFSKAVAQRCSVKKVFLEISQNSHENTCPRLPFKRRYSGKNIFSYRTPLVAACATVH